MVVVELDTVSTLEVVVVTISSVVSLPPQEKKSKIIGNIYLLISKVLY